jgi:lysophospholipase L1-like esterase
MTRTRVSRSAAIAAVVLCMPFVSAYAEDNPATTPAVGFVPGWQERHESLNARVKKGNVDLIFIGDSITHNWEGCKDLWDKYYGHRNAVNLGIGGDRTRQVLWRLDHGNIGGISPKLAVVMIGTNNSGENTPEQVAGGIKAVVEQLRTRLPQTKILLLAIFPRNDNAQYHQKNVKVNTLVAKMFDDHTFDDKMVTYMDIGRKFLTPDGTLGKDVMYDLLHLTPKGYTIWAEAIEPVVAKCVDGK